MRKIYAVGVVKEIPNKTEDFLQIRLFSKFENAEKSIMKNEGDLFEYYYDYAIIEESFICDEGEDSYNTPNTWWYKMDYKNNIVSSCDKPSKFENIVCFLSSFI